MGLGQLAVALALRTRRTPGLQGWRERGLELAVVVAGLCQVAGVIVPALRELLGTQSPGAAGLGIALGLAAVPGIVVALSRRREAGPEVPPVRVVGSC